MSARPRDIIIVRSLLVSDLGLFAAHRPSIRSKQRAIQINAPVARRLLSAEAWAAGGARFDCVTRCLGRTNQARRLLGKSHKNWRLGGPRMEGLEFAQLQVGDFALIRSVEGNDGSSPLSLQFIARRTHRDLHASVAAAMEGARDNLALFAEGEGRFTDLARMCPRELIAVRSLVESDLGLFAARRGAGLSRQRAININAVVAERLLDPAAFRRGGVAFDCICIYGATLVRGRRTLRKARKNWRLGGDKIEGMVFGDIDCRDFALIRSAEHNDGSHNVAVAFVSRNGDRRLHAKLVATVDGKLNGSMTLFGDDSAEFADLATHCPWPSVLCPA